jgi:hypothetical protein
MLQYDQQKINMETRLDSMPLYLEIQIRKTYIFKELLSHARLQPWFLL